MFEANNKPTTSASDAGLLGVGKEFREHRERVRSEWARADRLDEERGDGRLTTHPNAAAIYDAVLAETPRYHAMLDEMRDTPATTLAGMAVKADAIMNWLDPDRTGPDMGDFNGDGRVAWSLARDVLALQTRQAEGERDIIELARKFETQEARYIRTLYAMPEGPAADRALSRMRVGTDNPHFAKLRRARPTTRAGLQAMAHAALLEDAGLTTEHSSAGVALLVAIALTLLDGENPFAALKAELGVPA